MTGPSIRRRFATQEPVQALVIRRLNILHLLCVRDPAVAESLFGDLPCSAAAPSRPARPPGAPTETTVGPGRRPAQPNIAESSAQAQELLPSARPTISSTSVPYASSLARPIPGMASSAALSAGLRSAMASRV